jgi:osmotically-inducible protein OsmY
MRRNVMAVSFAALCLPTPLASEGAAKPAAGSAASDVALQDRVRAALARELGPPLNDVAVEVKGGAVTLGGRVADANTRWRIERIAAGVSGVTRVSTVRLVVALEAPARNEETRVQGI